MKTGISFINKFILFIGTVLLVCTQHVFAVQTNSTSRMQNMNDPAPSNEGDKDKIKPKMGDWVTVTFKYSYKDSILFDSKIVIGNPVLFRLPPPDFKGDLNEHITEIAVGDSADFDINADSLYLKSIRQPNRPSFIADNSVIHFHMNLLSVDSKESLTKKEEIALQKYIEDNKITSPRSESGLYFIEKVPGAGAKIDSGSFLKVNLTLSLIDGKKVFSSIERGGPLDLEFGQMFDTPGFLEGLSKMSKGGKAVILAPSGLSYGEMGKGGIVPPFATLVYDVEVIDIQSKADHEKQLANKKMEDGHKAETNKKLEAELLKQYLIDQKITEKPTTSGLIYVEKAKGTGTRATAGKKVKVHYTGTLLNGTKFDSSRDRNEPFEFVLGQGQVIAGWDEGIALMNVGGKAILVIPSNLAYGERSMGANLPAFSTLVFDVELLDVK
ncbi:MAG: FKBP-type peptidyl-prolyl cis-trans isomerase [Bacteroidales bacterium]